jgi:hypothetical protein
MVLLFTVQFLEHLSTFCVMNCVVILFESAHVFSAVLPFPNFFDLPQIVGTTVQNPVHHGNLVPEVCALLHKQCFCTFNKKTDIQVAPVLQTFVLLLYALMPHDRLYHFLFV